MATILHIETSNSVCSVCLSVGTEVVSLRENTEGNQHATLLTPFIQEVLAEGHITPFGLDAVCLSKGPGSYTGLRIGASAAKGICYATGKPLITVSTLKSMAAGYVRQHGPVGVDVLFCPMIDARRMEVYAALYNHNLEEVKPPQPWIIADMAFYEEFLENKTIICLGNGAAKAAPMFDSPKVEVDGASYLSALNLVALGVKAMEEQNFDNASYFEPQYLKNTVIL